MKRSEMVKKLQFHLQDLRAESMPYEMMASLALKIVEDAGMIPPPAELKKMDDVLNRSWEPEHNK